MVENQDSEPKNIKKQLDFVDQEYLKTFGVLQVNSLLEANKEALQFSGIQIQIASVLLGFSAVGSFIKGDPDVFFDTLEKIFLVSSWVTLTLSLFFGLLTSHVKQDFFFDDVKNQSFRLKTWRAYMEAEMSRPSALDTLKRFSEVAPLRSRSWPWIMQTVLLFLGTVGLFVVMILVLF